MILELNAEERDLLLEILRREGSELGPEIHHTDRTEYREDLKMRRHIVNDLVDRLALPQVH